MESIDLQQCAACGTLRWPHRPACPSCLAEEFALIPAGGTGRVWTYTVLHRTTPALQDQTPFCVAVVELDDKPGTCRLTARVQGCPPYEVAIGMPVLIQLRHGADGKLADFWFEPALR